MSQRERMMVLVLGALFLGGLGFAAYTLAVKPLIVKQKSLTNLAGEVVELNGEKLVVEERNQRLKDLYKRSLPPDPNFAKQEYGSLLIQLLEEANARGFSVDYDAGKSENKTGIPFLNPDNRLDKTPIYQRVVFSIHMKRTSLSVVMDFLKNYYKLNLLQQITMLEIKRDGSVDLQKDDRTANERTDLTVNITTEAIILNGTPTRKTLLYIPDANGAVLGGAGLYDMRETPSVGRDIVPYAFEKQLAANRDYLLIQAKDPFHGSLPPPPAPTPPPAVVVQVTPPKPDYSPFIRYSTLFRTTEGGEHTADVLIRDQINNEDYAITLTQSGEKVKVLVKKWYFIGPKAKLAGRGEELEISNAVMRTAHKFKVYGLDGDALIIGEKPSGLDSFAKTPDTKAIPGGVRPGRNMPGATRVILPPPDPKAAVVGGLVVTAPQQEKIYRWENGRKLNEIVELKGKEADKAIQRAQSGFLDRTLNTTSGTTTVAPDGK